MSKNYSTDSIDIAINCKEKDIFKLLFCTNKCRVTSLENSCFIAIIKIYVCFRSMSLNKHFQGIMLGTHIKGLAEALKFV